MIFINPNGRFADTPGRPYTEEMVKIQIENSLDLGWDTKDIVFVTNFPYEYGGVKTQVVPDDLFCAVEGKAYGKASKINVILYLMKIRQLRDNEMWWFHDLDAFQCEAITEGGLGMYRLPLGLTDYGWFSQVNTGSVFFTKDAERIFGWVRNVVYKQGIGEEPALEYLTDKNYQYINLYFKRLNITYNFPACETGIRHLDEVLAKTQLPIKVLHTHPFYHGVNWVKVNREKGLMPDRLYKFFERHLSNLCV
jgi:hypothetical protein